MQYPNYFLQCDQDLCFCYQANTRYLRACHDVAFSFLLYLGCINYLQKTAEALLQDNKDDGQK